ncbi:hypothetical protein HMI55_006453 [Coelomomyces lativittatus]|nr:hypothetical protein HMI55_006453 [Coelomomyces lativittatus]
MPSSKWCTIDSDPDIFRSLIKDFEAIGFDVKEVVELDMLPSNLMALIFCYRMDMEDYSPSFTEPIDLPTSLFFANQVISNACGTQAILHALLNIENLPEKCALGNTLENFKEFTSQMPYPVT